MSRPLQQAIMHNNEGVHHLNCGNISGALLAFQSAISFMKEATACHADKPRSILHIDWVFSREQQPGALDGLQSEHGYVYDRPILIPTDLGIFTSHELYSVVLTSGSFIIFNFALACQYDGKITGNKVPLQKARQLYELVLKMLTSEESNCNNCCVVLQCLVLNNLAQLHHDQCNYRKSQSCMQSLYDHIITTNCLDIYLDATEAEEIMLNLVHLRPPTVAGAA
jgi:hypothetical protein